MRQFRRISVAGTSKWNYTCDGLDMSASQVIRPARPAEIFCAIDREPEPTKYVNYIAVAVSGNNKKALNFFSAFVLPQVSNYWTSGMTSGRWYNLLMRILGSNLCWNELWKIKKTEGWDSQPCDSVFITTSDTPISSVMTADFLYPTKAKACVRPHFDKHRVNHLDGHPDLSAMSSLNHSWLFCSVKNYWKEVVGIVPDVLRYATPLFGYG